LAASPPISHRWSRSFPTRRSSDLPPAGQQADQPVGTAACGCARGARGSRSGHLASKVPVPASMCTENVFYLTYYTTIIWRERGLDRKSTRLNSSHSQISYAVFCLK